MWHAPKTNRIECRRAREDSDALLHAAREYVEMFREFGEPIDFLGQVEYECAKAAMAALALARATRRRRGTATWKPGAKDSALERELSAFIANAEQTRVKRLILADRDPSFLRR
jgi:hypothetical protein